MMNFDMMLAAKASSLGVTSEQVLWVIAQRVVNGDIDPDDDQLSVLLALTREDIEDE
ncbi:hypothetical protein [Vibrio agarivorans]|uniref:hypothetical protein n=1 Tax=Vibrio agarivorans TaxID=153622 RepID=UPI002231B22F|nr:hypothetical protein [Vibrio agarivorans]